MANNVVTIKIDADTGAAVKDIESVKSSVKGVSKETKSAGQDFGSLGSAADKATGGIVSGAKGAVGAVKGLVMGFKTLKFAIAATGIGLIVVIIASVVAAVSRLQGVMDKFKQFTAGLGAVMDVLGDTLAYIGEALINAFTNPQEALQGMLDGVKGLWDWYKKLWIVIGGTIIGGLLTLKQSLIEAAIAMASFFGSDATALKKELADTEKQLQKVKGAVGDAVDGIKQPFIDAAEAAGEFAGKLRDAAVAAAELEAAEQSLEDNRIGQIVTQAERNKGIAEARLLAEDETKSFAEREKALKRAIDLEKQNLTEKQANAQEELRILVAKNEIAESGREDKKGEAEAEARVIELQEQSLKQTKRIFTELQGLQKESAAANKTYNDDKAKSMAEMMALIEEDYDEEASFVDAALARQKNSDLEEVRSDAAKKEQLKIQTEDLNLFLDEEEQKKVDAQKLADDKELSDAQKVANAKKQLASAAFSAIQDLAVMFGEGDEKRARKAFEINKALNIGKALISTYQAVNTIIKAEDIPSAAKPFVIAAAVGTGLVNVAKIKSTQFGSVSGGPPPSPPSFGGSGGSSSAPQLNTDALQTDNQTSIRAYVVSKDVTTASAQNQQIEQQANLVL
jgi:chemotaxis protein histidine kinase CheA